jgi:hypothetical protein
MGDHSEEHTRVEDLQARIVQSERTEEPISAVLHYQHRSSPIPKFQAMLTIFQTAENQEGNSNRRVSPNIPPPN